MEGVTCTCCAVRLVVRREGTAFLSMNIPSVVPTRSPCAVNGLLHYALHGHLLCELTGLALVRRHAGACFRSLLLGGSCCVWFATTTAITITALTTIPTIAIISSSTTIATTTSSSSSKTRVVIILMYR